MTTEPPADVARREIVLVPSDRAAALERVTRRLVHDLRNPIAAILHFTEDIAAGAEPGSALAEDIGLIEQAVREALGHLNEMRALVYREPASRGEESAGEHARRVVEDLRAAAPDGVEVRIDVDDDVPPVRADAETIELLVGNVLRNAIEAVGGAGAIAVEVRRTGAGEAEVVTTDDGPGMDVATIGRSAEPFFTTAAQPHGRGVGLAFVAAALNGLGGRLSIASTPGAGTRVRVVLPPA